VAVEAVWRAVSAAAVVPGEAAEVGILSLSVAVVVFVEIFLQSPRLRFLFHPYCLRLELELKLSLNEVVGEAEEAPARYLYCSPRLSGWSCSRTPPRREPAIVVASSCF
jgi:hypothetical protein